jgi:hypothetical protein
MLLEFEGAHNVCGGRPLAVRLGRQEGGDLVQRRACRRP